MLSFQLSTVRTENVLEKAEKADPKKRAIRI